MKWVVILTAILIGASSSNAQGLKQWFRQKQTQTEYLLQQIAALKVYTGYLQRGYRIVQGGLNTISDIKSGHFKLDQAFFDGLKMINPRVKNYARVADVIRLNIQTVKLSGRALKESQGSGLFSGKELNYTEKVFMGVLNGCNELMDRLITILTPDELQLSDDERIRRIDQIYTGMIDQYQFVNIFYRDLQSLGMQRNKELHDIKSVQKLYGQ